MKLWQWLAIGGGIAGTYYLFKPKAADATGSAKRCVPTTTVGKSAHIPATETAKAEPSAAALLAIKTYLTLNSTMCGKGPFTVCYNPKTTDVEIGMGASQFVLPWSSVKTEFKADSTKPDYVVYLPVVGNPCSGSGSKPDPVKGWGCNC